MHIPSKVQNKPQQTENQPDVNPSTTSLAPTKPNEDDSVANKKKLVFEQLSGFDNICSATKAIRSQRFGEAKNYLDKTNGGVLHHDDYALIAISEGKIVQALELIDQGIVGIKKELDANEYSLQNVGFALLKLYFFKALISQHEPSLSEAYRKTALELSDKIGINLSTTEGQNWMTELKKLIQYKTDLIFTTQEIETLTVTCNS